MKLLFRAILLVTLAAGFAAAQNIPFQILLTSGSNSFTVSNDSTVAFNAEVGQSATIQVHATYTGNGTITISQQPVVLGATGFTVALDSSVVLPLTMHPSDTLAFTISYKSAGTSQAGGQMSLSYSETLPGATGGQVTTTNAIILLLQGTSPSLQLSYVLASAPNVVALPPGATLPFPGTQINTTASANLDITNVGSGSGSIKSISQPTNPVFKLTGLPLFPVTIPSGQTLATLITYAPTAIGTDNDQIQITLASGTVLTVLLQGSGISATFTYQLIANGTSTPVTTPGPIALPDTNIGSTSSVIVQVQNTGNATGVIAGVPSVSGAGFSVSGAPLFPQTLTAGSSFTFTLNFAPTQPGSVQGTLVVGSALFNLTGNGLGPSLGYSYVSSGGTITLPTNNPVVVFSPIAVSQSESVTFVVTNNGTTSATISSIAIGETNSPYSVLGAPAPPITVAAGQSFQFTLSFAPLSAGFSNGSLHIDTTSISLTGSGTAPPPLPSYKFVGPSGNVSPVSQPSIGLTLSAPYPLALTGTLTLTTSGTLVADPSVQFSTGGKTVSFVIPANSTTANFAGLGSSIFLQTGSVAGSILLTPSFSTQTGGINLTPSNPTTLQLTVPSNAPALQAITVSGQSSTGFVVNVIGYSTTRSVSSLAITFTPATGFTFTAPQFTVDLTQISSVWFGSASSQSFGGQFEVSIPFTLSGTLPTGQTLIQALASVSATVSNSVGASNSVQTAIQ